MNRVSREQFGIKSPEGNGKSKKPFGLTPLIIPDLEEKQASGISTPRTSIFKKYVASSDIEKFSDDSGIKSPEGNGKSKKPFGLTPLIIPDLEEKQASGISTPRTSIFKKYLASSDIKKIPDDSPPITSKSLGAGSFSEIYELSKDFQRKILLDNTDDKFVAKVQNLRVQLYVIRSREFQRNDQKEIRKSMEETLFSEYFIQKGLNHPNILPVKRQYIDKTAEKEMLYTILPEAQKLEIKDLTLDDIKGLLEGLKYMHSLDFIHKDIHPGNIMRYKGQAVWVDMGKASHIQNTEFRGRADYMPNNDEDTRTSDTEASPKSDIFSFGLVLKHWIKNLKATDQRVMSKNDLKALETLSFQLIEENPKKRFSAKQALNFLERRARTQDGLFI